MNWLPLVGIVIASAFVLCLVFVITFGPTVAIGALCFVLLIAAIVVFIVATWPN